MLKIVAKLAPRRGQAAEMAQTRKRLRHKTLQTLCVLLCATVGWEKTLVLGLDQAQRNLRPFGARSPCRLVLHSVQSDSIWDAAKAAADESQVDVESYLVNVTSAASKFLQSGAVVNRHETVLDLMRSMEEKGILTIVLGAKSIGKSRLKRKAIDLLRNQTPSLTLLDVELRTPDHRGPCFEASLVAAAQRTATTQERKQLDGLFGPVSLLLSAAGFVVSGQVPPATGGPASAAIGMVTEKLLSVFERFVSLRSVQTSFTSIVVDDAQIRLGCSEMGSETKDFMKTLVGWTKEKFNISATLISSDFSYPYLFQAAGLDPKYIHKTIIVTDIPEEDMTKMLVDDWGMTPKFAKAFYEVFGGDIATSQQALQDLSKYKDNFDPFAVEDLPEMSTLMRDSKARAHLKAMASKGWSPVADPFQDGAAENISKGDVGAVLRRADAGLSSQATQCKYVIVPSTLHIRKLLAHEFRQARRMKIMKIMKWLLPTCAAGFFGLPRIRNLL